MFYCHPSLGKIPILTIICFKVVETTNQYIYMGVSNRGTPKWMVYNGKPYWNGWFGGKTHYFRKHPYTYIMYIDPLGFVYSSPFGCQLSGHRQNGFRTCGEGVTAAKLSCFRKKPNKNGAFFLAGNCFFPWVFKQHKKWWFSSLGTCFSMVFHVFFLPGKQ